MKKLFFLIILTVFLTACAKNNLYVPPDSCVKDMNGNYGSVILQKIPDPNAASIILQLANLEAVKHVDGYTIGMALTAIDIIESLLKTNITFNYLIDEAMKQAKLVNASYGVEIFLISQYVGVINTPQIISDCDRDLILRHLEKQRQTLKLAQ